MSLAAELRALLVARDVEGVIRVVDGLSADELAEAAAWYLETGYQDLPLEGGPGIHERLAERELARNVLTVGLLSPRDVINTLNWHALPDHVDRLVERILRRPKTWRAQLVRTAAGWRLQGGWRAIGNGDLYRIVRRVCMHDGLEIPVGPVLVDGWLWACTPRREWGAGGFSPVDPAEAVTLLRADGRYREMVPLALEHRGLGDLPWMATAFATLAAAGELDRTQLVAHCFAQLDSPGRPSEQKVIARLVDELRLSPTEVPGGMARIQQVLATCHGSVTARLLPLAVGALASAEDVEELAATIAARPEKKQRSDLLRVLTATDTRERLGDDAVRAGLQVLAEVSDAVLARKASAALTMLGGAEPAPAVTAVPRLGLWDRVAEDTRPPNDRFTELSTFDDNAVAVVRRAAQASPRMQPIEPFYEPVALSIVVRWAWREGLDAVRARIGAKGPIRTLGYDETSLGLVLPGWLAGRSENAWPPHFGTRHVAESLHRAGRVPFLLSTPTRPNGGLDLDALVERLRGSADVGFGPLDLLQAILRLRPVDPARAVELDGLPRVPPDPSAGTSTAVPDATAYLRDAIAAGRFLPPPITPEQLLAEGWQDGDGQPPGGFWLAMLPVDPADLGSHLDELATVHPNYGSADLRSVAPWCPDLRLRGIGQWRLSQGWSTIPAGITEAAGPMGVAVHDALFREYASDRAETRREAVQQTLTGIGRRTYAPRPAVTAAAGRLANGRLNLSRCAQAWEQVFLSGGLYPVWHVALHTADLAVAQPRRPPGLADLLRMLTTYAAEVPRESRQGEVPPRLAAYAAEKGTTKGHAEARRFVAALHSA